MQNCCLGSFWFLEGEVSLHYCGAVYGFYLLFFVSALRGFEFDFCSYLAANGFFGVRSPG